MIEIQLTQNQIDVEISKQPDIEITLEKQGPAGQGIPTGGETSQVLAKKSNDNYDTEWVNPGESNSKWEADESDSIKPKDDKLVDYKYLKNKPDMTQYQKMAFDEIIGNFITF